MENNNEHLRASQQDRASAENKGPDRSAHQIKKNVLSDEERQNLAAQMGEGPNAIVGLKDLGAFSGRDDAPGVNGDSMENESTTAPTNR